MTVPPIYPGSIARDGEFVVISNWRRASKEFCNMKKVLICSLLAIAMVCCGSILYAQDTMTQGGSAPMGGHRMSVDQRLEHMTRQLNLTTDQQQKIKPILEQEQQQMMGLHQDSSMSQQDRMSKAQSIRQSTMDQIKPILTTEQQQKWEQMQTRGMQGGHGGMGQGGGMAQPQQSPPQ